MNPTFLTTTDPSASSRLFAMHSSFSSAGDDHPVMATTEAIFTSSPNIFSTPSVPKSNAISYSKKNGSIANVDPDSEINPMEAFGLTKLVRTTDAEDLAVDAEDSFGPETSRVLLPSASSFAAFSFTTTTTTTRAPMIANSWNFGNNIIVSTDYEEEPKLTNQELPKPASRMPYKEYTKPSSVAQPTVMQGEFGRTKSGSSLVYDPNQVPQQLPQQTGKIFIGRTSLPFFPFHNQPG
ncbi:unnamed protein product [Gongylonema pulchrum]|uniref:Ovule protein n=1 Tax=Gongylonema pulchrum TaxID=637853 RepID=A0A183DCM0_9BILA|nr:unnamed protein product [Gongylonema pulchrum]